jgi:hypothetical protein
MKTAVRSSPKSKQGSQQGLLKLPVSVQSIAGYVAMSRQLLNIADVYDADQLQRIHPQLSFLNREDKRSGYHATNGAPVMANVCFTYSRSSTTTATSPSAFLKKTAHGSFVDPGHCASPARYGGWRMQRKTDQVRPGGFFRAF